MFKKIIIWFEKQYIVSLIIAVLIACLIFYLSSIPAANYPPGLGISTKVYHIGIYFLLALFLTLSIVKGNKKNKYFIIIAILLAMFYATTDELHQVFVPGRMPAFTDVMIDSIGAMFAGILYSIELILKKDTLD